MMSSLTGWSPLENIFSADVFTTLVAVAPPCPASGTSQGSHFVPGTSSLDIHCSLGKAKTHLSGHTFASVVEVSESDLEIPLNSSFFFQIFILEWLKICLAGRIRCFWHTQKYDFVTITNICDTYNRAWCSYTDYNRICSPNSPFGRLCYFLVRITFFSVTVTKYKLSKNFNFHKVFLRDGWLFSKWVVLYT